MSATLLFRLDLGLHVCREEVSDILRISFVRRTQTQCFACSIPTFGGKSSGLVEHHYDRQRLARDEHSSSYILALRTTVCSDS